MVDPAQQPPTEPDAPPRVALAHDWLVGVRGGEQVLDAIVRLLGRGAETGPVYTLFDDGRPTTPAIDALERMPSPIAPLPGRRWLLPLYPFAVRRLSAALALDHRRSPFGLLISTSSAAIKGMTAPPGVPHLCYCHSPARYLWDQGPQYARGSPLRSLGLRCFGPALRHWDRRTATSPTTIVANSKFTAARIRRVWDRDSLVIYPPVDTEYFTPSKAEADPDAWLIVSALEPYKRVDLAIDAARRAGKRLVIVGTGSQAGALRRLAGPADGRGSVEFAGRVSRDRLRALYRTSGLMLFPQVEDFGIAAAEAQACGCPVLARDEGGAAEIIVDGQTGALASDATPGALLDAIERVPKDPGAACRTNALRFAESVFLDRMGTLIRAVLAPKS